MSYVLLAGLLFAFVIESVIHATSGGHLHGHQGCGDECDDLQNPDEFHEIDIEMECGQGLPQEKQHLHDCSAYKTSPASS